MPLPLSNDAFTLPPLIDYAATALWSLSGALVAVRRRFDIVGMVVIALVTALGGAIMRDSLFLNVQPVVVVYPWYLPIVAVTAMSVAFVRRRVAALLAHRVIDTLDALGMGAYAVVGMQKAMSVGFPPAGVVLVGMVNAVGGGILRDLLTGESPSLFQPAQFYALPVVVACLIFWGSVHYGVLSGAQAAFLVMGFCVAVRTLALRYDWRTRALDDEEADVNAS